MPAAARRRGQSRPVPSRTPRATLLPVLPQLRPWSRPRQALRLLLSGATARTCLPVAVAVGTVLSLINQADVIVAGTAGEGVALKVVANYAIPFLTSSTGALLAVRERPVDRGASSGA